MQQEDGSFSKLIANKPSGNHKQEIAPADWINTVNAFYNTTFNVCQYRTG